MAVHTDSNATEVVADALDRLSQRLEALETRHNDALDQALQQLTRCMETLKDLQNDTSMREEVETLYSDIAALRIESGGITLPRSARNRMSAEDIDAPLVTAARPDGAAKPAIPAPPEHHEAPSPPEAPGPITEGDLVPQMEGEVPMTPGTRLLLRQVEELGDRVATLLDADTLPGTDKAVDPDFQAEIAKHWDSMKMQFDSVFDGLLTEADSKYQVTRAKGLPCGNPMTFWSGKALRTLSDFRTRQLIETFFDPVELRVNQLKDRDYSRLMDQLTAIFNLERVDVTIGRTPFDENLHECVDINSEKPREEDQERVVNRVLLSGYMDLADQTVVRKAFVKTRVRTVGETQSLKIRSTSTASASRTPTPPPEPAPNMLDTDAKAMTVSDLGEVMVPKTVSTIKAQVTKLNGSLTKVLGTDLPNEIGGAVNLEVRAAVMDLVARYYRQFTQFHERSKALAFLNYKRLKAQKTPNLTPAAGWDEQMMYEYNEYRRSRLMKDCLDHIEDKISQLGMSDHQKVLDLLAAYMDVERIPVHLNASPFDPDVHTLDSERVTHANAKGRPISRLLQSGYVDMQSNELLRKATVRVNA